MLAIACEVATTTAATPRPGPAGCSDASARSGGCRLTCGSHLVAPWRVRRPVTTQRRAAQSKGSHCVRLGALAAMGPRPAPKRLLWPHCSSTPRLPPTLFATLIGKSEGIRQAGRRPRPHSAVSTGRRDEACRACSRRAPVCQSGTVGGHSLHATPDHRPVHAESLHQGCRRIRRLEIEDLGQNLPARYLRFVAQGFDRLL